MRATLRLYDGYAIFPVTGEPGTAFLAPVVRELQEALRLAGESVGNDGLFGPATEQVVKRWQEASGLDADGVQTCFNFMTGFIIANGAAKGRFGT